VTTEDVNRIHDRIDRLDEKWGKEWSKLADSVNAASEMLATEVALCRSCRRMVMGNGRPSIDKRVNTLETLQTASSKWFTVAVVASASLVSGVVVAIVGHILG